MGYTCKGEHLRFISNDIKLGNFDEQNHNELPNLVTILIVFSEFIVNYGMWGGEWGTSSTYVTTIYSALKLWLGSIIKFGSVTHTIP